MTVTQLTKGFPVGEKNSFENLINDVIIVFLFERDVHNIVSTSETIYFL